MTTTQWCIRHKKKNTILSILVSSSRLMQFLTTRNGSLLSRFGWLALNTMVKQVLLVSLPEVQYLATVIIVCLLLSCFEIKEPDLFIMFHSFRVMIRHKGGGRFRLPVRLKERKKKPATARNETCCHKWNGSRSIDR